MKLKISYFFIFIFIILIFQNYSLVLTSSLDAVTIWLHKVFPFLFIMFVLNDILINLNIASLFTKTTPYIIIMSLLSGAPSNAFIISSLTEKKVIDTNSANIYLTFTYFANPLFLYSFLNLLFTPLITFKLIIIHYLANIFIFLKMRKKITNQNWRKDNG